MASVFNTQQTYAGGFTAGQLTLAFGGANVGGYVVQSVDFTFRQELRMLYEVGSANVYYVGGRAQGQATLARVIGPTALAGQFISKYNDLCNPQDITFIATGQPSGKCPASAGLNYTLASAVLTSIAGSTTAQEVVFNERLEFMFADLQYSGAGGALPNIGGAVVLA